MARRTRNKLTVCPAILRTGIDLALSAHPLLNGSLLAAQQPVSPVGDFVINAAGDSGSEAAFVIIQTTTAVMKWRVLLAAERTAQGFTETVHNLVCVQETSDEQIGSM